MDDKAIFKFNNGNGALLCSKCRVIIKTGKDFTEEEINAIKGKVDMPPQYCKQCKPNIMAPQEKASYLVVRYMSKVVSKKLAIECALVAVQEIICSNPHSNPLNTDVTSTMKWWMDVQKEIEKL